MADLRTASKEITNAKKVNQSSWEDSTYRQRIETTLKEVAPGLEGERLERATKFFKAEWEIRSQKFLKRFMMWSTRGKDADKVDFLSFAKFGNNQILNVAAIANNLDIGFPAAILQVVQLVALNLARRVEPTVTPRGDPTFNVIFLPGSYMRFFLGAMDVAEAEFSDDDLHELATSVFAHDIETNRPVGAVDIIKTAVTTKHAFEEGAKQPTEAVRDLCQKVLRMFQARPKEAHSLPIIATNLKVDPRMVTFCALVLALHDKEFVRVVTTSSTKPYTLSFSLGAPVASQPIAIGSLSTQHAKEVLKAAAAQSPMSHDPVIPPGMVKLDAAMLGAATIEQLQKTEQSLRERIEQVGSSLSTRIMNLASDVDEANKVKPDDTGWTSSAVVGLQAQIVVLRDQVAVLMKLAGVGERAMTVHTASLVASAETKQKKPKRPRVTKKKAKKAAPKKTKKKAKKRR